MSFFQNGAIVHQLTSTATAGGTTTLTSSSKQYQVFTGVSAQTVRLPDANTMKNGMVFTIINDSTQALTINYNDNSLATTIDASTSKDFVLFDNSTSNGSFDISVGSSSGGGASQADLNILRTGQLSGNSLTSKKVSFNPERVGSDSWVTKTSLSVVKTSSQGFTLNGFLYQVGGTNSGSSPITDNQRYDDANNLWLARAVVTTGRYQAVGGTAQGYGFAIGGSDGASSQSVNERYSDALNSWSSRATTLTARNSMAPQALDHDGKIFICGGGNGGGTLTNADFFDDSSNAWYVRSSITGQRSNQQTFNINGVPYFAGGDNSGLLSTGQKFSIIGNAWTSITNLPSARRHGFGISALYSGLVYNGVVAGPTVTNTMDEYLDVTNAWRSRAPSTAALRGMGGGIVNGTVYSCGGASTDDYSATTAAVYGYTNFSFSLIPIDFKTAGIPSNIFLSAKIKDLSYTLPAQIRSDGDAWKTIDANDQTSLLKFGETYKGKFVESSLGYVFGGDDAVSVYRTAVEYYHDSINVWQVRQSLATARGYFGGFKLRGLGYIVAGSTGGGVVSTVLAYDDLSNSYTSKASIATARQFANGFQLNDYGYATGGNDGSTLATVLKYDASADSWSSAGSLNTARFGHSAWMQNGRGYVNQGSGGSNTTEQYSDVANTWLSRANSSNSLDRKLCFAFNNYGYSSCGVSPSSAHERYNDSLNSWSTLASLNANRSYGSGWFQGGFGYAAGGAQGSTPLSSSEAFNDANNTWTNKASMNTSRQAITSGISPGVFRTYEVRIGIPSLIEGLGGGAWITRASPGFQIGGQGVNLDSFAYGIDFSGFGRKYNSLIDSYTRIGSSTIADIGYRTMFAFLGFGYNGMPNSGTGSVRQQFEQLNPDTDLFTSKTSSTSQHGIGAGFSLNGYGYVCGGDAPGVTNVVERYDAAANSWSTMTAMNNTREGGSSGGTLNGYGYMIGAQNAAANGGSERYNDANNSWFTITAHPVGIAYCSVAGFNGYLHASGGNTSTVAYKYADSLNSWSQISNTNLNCSAEAVVVTNGSMFLLTGTGSATQQFAPNLSRVVVQAALDVS